MTADVLAFTGAFALLATFVVAGFALLFTEMRRLEGKLDGAITGFRGEVSGLRHDLAEEFRAQRAEVLAQTTALANAITAARS
jgi:hypothetical protein